MIFAAALGLATLAAGTPAEEPPGVRVEHRPGVTALYAKPPGRILSVVTPAGAQGDKRVILLVAPKAASEEKEKEKKDEGDEAVETDPPKDPCADPADQVAEAARKRKPRLLMQLDPKGEGALHTLRDDLPSDVRGMIAADVNGDGHEDLVLSRSKSISVLLGADDGGWAGALENVVGFSEENSTTPRIGALAAPGGAALWMIDLGAVRTFARGVDGTWNERPRIPIPVTAVKKEAALVLTGVAVEPLDRHDPHAPLATGPEALGGDRLRTIVIRPDAAEGERSAECWSHLPTPEKLMEADYLNLASGPALFVATRPGEKLSIFGEQLVRLFPLSPDRTRLGKAPLAAFVSGANLWQQIHPSIAEVSGDGVADLIVAYWKGLKDNTVVLEAYLGKPDGSFETKARTTEFDVENADRGMLVYGENLDGAGLPDLILKSKGALQFYPGAATPDAGRHLVATRPAWSIQIPGTIGQDTRMEISIGSEGFSMSSTRPPSKPFRVLDLDGDGRPELLCVPELGFSANSLAILRLGS